MEKDNRMNPGERPKTYLTFQPTTVYPKKWRASMDNVGKGMKKLAKALNSIEGFEVLEAERKKDKWYIEFALDKWDDDAQKTLDVWKRFEKVCQIIETKEMEDYIDIRVLPMLNSYGELTYLFVGRNINPKYLAQSIGQEF